MALKLIHMRAIITVVTCKSCIDEVNLEVRLSMKEIRIRQLSIRNVSDSTLLLEPDSDIHLRVRTPKELLEADEWTWNGKHQEWGIDNNLTEVKT